MNQTSSDREFSPSLDDGNSDPSLLPIPALELAMQTIQSRNSAGVCICVDNFSSSFFTAPFICYAALSKFACRFHCACSPLPMYSQSGLGGVPQNLANNSGQWYVQFCFVLNCMRAYLLIVLPLFSLLPALQWPRPNPSRKMPSFERSNIITKQCRRILCKFLAL